MIVDDDYYADITCERCGQVFTVDAEFAVEITEKFPCDCGGKLGAPVPPFREGADDPASDAVT